MMMVMIKVVIKVVDSGGDLSPGGDRESKLETYF
jgi:hypothetical protein